MKTLTNKLNSEFKKLHAKLRTVSINHVKELQEEINEWKHKGQITEKFFNKIMVNLYFTHLQHSIMHVQLLS